MLHDWCFGFEPSGSLARDQKQYGGTRNVADKQMAKKSIRRGGVSETNICCPKRMPELENNLVNFMLPLCLANLAQDRKTRCRDEITSSKNRLRFRLDINLEMDHPSKTIYPSVSTSSRRANRRISLRRILLDNSSSYRIYIETNYPSLV